MTEPIDLSAFKPLEQGVAYAPINYERDPALGYVDTDGILSALNRRPFSSWDVPRIVGCSQPKVYDGARLILAKRTLPYFRELFSAMDEYDIDIDTSRIDFVIETLNMEMPDLFDTMVDDPRVKNVLWSYCSGARNLRKLMTQHTDTSHDFALGLALSMKLGVDVLALLGFRVRRREVGSPHPLSHSPLKLPGQR